MFQELRNNWAETSGSRKGLLVGGVLIVLLLFVYLSVWAFKKEYQVLFSDLDPQDAAQMVAELDKLKTEYKLQDNGTTILVDKESVYKTRLKLMGKGLTLKGNVGFELFNNTDYGTTEFAQKVNYQRALQGELARTIMAFDEVKQARVHLVLPDRGLLKKQTGQAKASITLAMNGNARLTPQQVIGIQRLVATAVPEMETTSVTVLDHQGIALTPNIVGDASSGWSTAKFEVKKEIEDYFNKKVSSLLDKALGANNTMVSIDVTLNYDQIKITKEDIVPTVKAEKLAKVIVPDLPNSKQVAASKDTSDIDSESFLASASPKDPPLIVKSKALIDEDLPGGRRVEQIVSEPGAIKRISVGVIVPAGFDEQRISQLREIIAMTVGLNAGRGDAIAVHSVDQIKQTETLVEPSLSTTPPADTLNTDKPVQVKKSLETNDTIIFSLLAVGVLVVLLIFLKVFSTKGRERNTKRALSTEEREQMLRQISDWIKADVKQTDLEKS